MTRLTSLRAVVEGDGHAVGNSLGIAGCELGVFDDAGTRDQVEQGGVAQPLGRELLGRDLAVDQRDGRAVGQAVVGCLAGPRAPFLGVFADDLDGRCGRWRSRARGFSSGHRSRGAASNAAAIADWL